MELDEIVDKLLAKNPNDRPFNARNVQAVMLQLGETPLADADGIQAVSCSDAARADVAADDVAARGREILKEKIQDRLSGAVAAEISWGKLAVMLAAIVGVIAVAAMLRG